MKTLFLISSTGDANLAFATAECLKRKYESQCFFIALTKTATQQNYFTSLPSDQRTSLCEILNRSPDTFTESCSEEEIRRITEFIQTNGISHVYVGVPSINNNVPFQIATAASLKNIPILVAYEFMFRPLDHCLWRHINGLNSPNIKWAVPLSKAREDFVGITSDRIGVIGHLSIDAAFSTKPSSPEAIEKIKRTLQVTPGQSLAFLSGTTQPTEIDAAFLDAVLTELPKHPTVQVRLGPHPGIPDPDAYLNVMLSICAKHPNITSQFKIILPANLKGRLKSLNTTDPIFLQVDIGGAVAASAADSVAQAVPGALLNQAALEGTPSYSYFGESYLPKKYFSENLSVFFEMRKQPSHNKQELGLDEKTAPECCAEIISRS